MNRIMQFSPNILYVKRYKTLILKCWIKLSSYHCTKLLFFFKEWLWCRYAIQSIFLYVSEAIHYNSFTVTLYGWQKISKIRVGGVDSSIDTVSQLFEVVNLCSVRLWRNVFSCKEVHGSRDLEETSCWDKVAKMGEQPIFGFQSSVVPQLAARCGSIFPKTCTVRVIAEADRA